jgi:hypothetical protein
LIRPGDTPSQLASGAKRESGAILGQILYGLRQKHVKFVQHTP